MARHLQAPSLEDLLSQTDADDAAADSDSPFNITNFVAFLVRSHCEENYEFWKSCNYYLNNVDGATFDFVRWNTAIYENFIKVNAPMECNLPEDIRKAYMDWYVDSIIPSRDIVLKARQHTLNLMSDAYRQFVRHVNSRLPAVAVDGETDCFPKSPLDRKRADQLALKRSLTASDATKNGASVSTSSTSTSSSRAGSAVTTQNKGPLGLLSKGKALVAKFKRKSQGPALKKASSTGSALPVCASEKRSRRYRT
ncbi:hypothetical protein HG536_0D03360 [Torulaspora globosa]|uniref:RGS domain-containing protein n=1 Tax=Torulaspora globosa TaxID=48254 RepID=A0A7G3ZH28_9SACH|nr:uncharacterized protein HG536_0D03360 [Torulaspora globosa]QLL32814.1 hypothetical protein HG536_0D03360 [Torulaspora globosa]